MGCAIGQCGVDLILLVGGTKGLTKLGAVAESAETVGPASSAANAARLAKQLLQEEAASGVVHLNQPAETTAFIQYIFEHPDVLRGKTPSALLED